MLYFVYALAFMYIHTPYMEGFERQDPAIRRSPEQATPLRGRIRLGISNKSDVESTLYGVWSKLNIQQTFVGSWC